MTPPRTRRSASLVLGIVVFGSAATACLDVPDPVEPTGPAVSFVVEQHLNEIFAAMVQLSVNRYSRNWSAIANVVIDSAGEAQTVPEAYAAVRTALRSLDDASAFYVGADGTVLDPQGARCSPAETARPDGLPATIGYLRLRPFAAANSTQRSVYADSVQDLIRQADGDSLVGWIVDLRGDGAEPGGDRWAQIGGIAPLLGEGVIGGSIDPDGAATQHEHFVDDVVSNGEVEVAIPSPYRVRDLTRPVALLLDAGTRADGEAVLVAFQGRDGVRSFGAPTCGAATAPLTAQLSNGARLTLGVATLTDRSGIEYRGPIAPDEAVDGDADVVARAVAWLQAQ